MFFLTLNMKHFLLGDLKVAFSAGLTDSGSVGPFDEETTLIFSKTITNIGRAYNQSAGKTLHTLTLDHVCQAEVKTIDTSGLHFPALPLFGLTHTTALKCYLKMHVVGLVN